MIDPPYLAVIFTNRRTDHDDAGYVAAAARMESRAAAITQWREHPDHLDTQAQGRDDWYEWYELRVARVERARSWRRSDEPA